MSAFAQTLRRYTSLNHLAQAARAVLQNTSQINQMLTDLNRVDFANVQVNFSDLQLILLPREMFVPKLASSFTCVSFFVDRSKHHGCVSVRMQ